MSVVVGFVLADAKPLGVVVPGLVAEELFRLPKPVIVQRGKPAFGFGANTIELFEIEIDVVAFDLFAAFITETHRKIPFGFDFFIPMDAM